MSRWTLFITLSGCLLLFFIAQPCPASEECFACHLLEILKATDRGKKVLAPIDSKNLAGSVHQALSCGDRHPDAAMVPHPKKMKAVACESCHGEEPRKILGKSVHASIPSCSSCHGTHEIQSKVKFSPAHCATCHPHSDQAYQRSVHGLSQKKGQGKAARCQDCHGGHDIRKKGDSRSQVYPLNLPRTCGRCHVNPELIKKYKIPAPAAYQLYMDNIHGRALTRSGLLVAAVCSNCHGSHEILPSQNPASSTSRGKIPETCGTCHAGVLATYGQSIHGQALKKGDSRAPACTDCHSAHRIQRVEVEAWKLGVVRECGTCHLERMMTYRDTFHGHVTSFGSAVGARCSDCHGAHDILPPADPRSTIHKKNIVATCGKCHAKATPSFTQFYAHADHRNKEQYPILYYTDRFMVLLLLFTFSLFGVHTFLWLPRSLRDRLHRRREKRQAIERKGVEVYYLRLNLFHRLMHVMVILSFMGLVLTGMPLKFSYSPIVQKIAPYLGGFQTAAFIHRICALFTFFYFGLHLCCVAYLHFKKKQPGIFWGPNSMVPQLEDFKNFFRHFRWFLGLGPRPQFGRFTYWEKFDYWAVFWGVSIIGTSGLFLWFPTFFAQYFPGWIFNVAFIVHSDEALLAAGFIFSIHFFNTHLRPTKFPLDHVIITGRISEEDLLYEHPLEYQQMQKEGTLARKRTDPPPLWMMNLSRIVGFSALAIGIAIITVIIFALLEKVGYLLIFLGFGLPFILTLLAAYFFWSYRRYSGDSPPI
ncbi:MAG: cytochrome c3 family protein [Thermodesulfobacteriota bacterium]|nr:cytochrome c3 family protein [Thermodesulfobacteriota bacterium]